MFSERYDGPLRQHHGTPRALGLRLGEDVATALLMLQGPPYLEARLVEVDIAPLQAQQLSQSHPGRDCQDIERVVPVVLREREELVDLFARQRADLGPLGSGRVNSF